MDFANRIFSQRFHKYSILGVVILLASSASIVNGSRKEKRQIYREQVLPSSGGKIPESAFRTDRLNLNQLNKDGFSVPDGVVINHRRHLRHPYPYHQEPELLKVYLSDDGRFVSVFGKYVTKFPEAIDTTYLIRSPVKLKSNYLNLILKHLEASSKRVFEPILKPLIIPNSATFGNMMKENTVGYQNRRQKTNASSESLQTSKYYLPSSIKASYQKFESMLFTPQIFRKQMKTNQGGQYRSNGSQIKHEKIQNETILPRRQLQQIKNAQFNTPSSSKHK